MTAADLPVRADVFRYRDLDLDARSRSLICTYEVGGRRFEERITLEQGSVDAPGAEVAAQLVFLLAGVSYYKAFAPEVVDLGAVPLTDEVRSLLHGHYVEGLGEFAYHNGLDLRGLQFVGGEDVAPTAAPDEAGAVQRPLVPFGGGLDSLVSIELVTRTTPDAVLFVVSQAGTRFDAIETAAGATGLPVLRATRLLDPAILQSRQLGFLSGHIPITGIISAIAVLAAVTADRDAVVMSNEWSASSGTREHNGQLVNHQYSKSLEFERAFRAATQSILGPQPRYYSLLRPFSELWIAREFAGLRRYHRTFRSCNRAFHIDPTQRLERWCGRCDKCVFIDLILSPFLEQAELAEIFDGEEPLQNPALLDTFRSLLGTSVDKPFECVGDEEECRAAVQLAAERPDRAGNELLRALVPEAPVAFSAVERLLAPLGEHFIPEPHASDVRLV